MSQTGVPLVGSYDLRLVSLSFFIAILASYIAYDLAVRVTFARGRLRGAWLAGGAIAMGFGIWSMHFVGMLAFRLPIPVRYDLPTVLLSLLSAILASAIAMCAVGGESLGRRDALAGGLAMGGGIAGMHYLGMASMRLAAIRHNNPLLLGLSVLIAVISSLAGLVFLFDFHGEPRRTWAKLAGAVIMGLAITTMHYTGMASASFESSDLPVNSSHALSVSWIGVAGIVMVTLLTLGFAFLTTFIDAQFAARTLQLRSSEQLVQQSRELIDAIPQQIWSGPIDGTLDYCNNRWRSYMGLGLEELQGDGWQSMLHPGDRERVLKAWRESVANGTPYEQEERHRGADGEYRWFLARGVPLRDSKGRVVRWYGTNTDIEDRKRAEGELQRLSGQLLQSQDEERRRIARDLHDSTGQNLVALATMLGQAAGAFTSAEPKSRTLLSECRTLVDQCIREIRTLSYVLHPPVLDEAGLEDAIRDYVAGFTKRSGTRVVLELPSSADRLARDIELALFRVVQESLANIQRHSGSQEAKIFMSRGSNLVLEISDTGRGDLDDPPNAENASTFEGGVGILSMKERVKLIGGQFDIDSTRQGTIVRVTVPLGEQEREKTAHSNR